MTTQTYEELPRESFAWYLDRARKTKGISKAEAVRQLGTTIPTHNNWLRGGLPEIWRDPDLLQRLAEFCEVPEFVILASVGLLSWEDAERLYDNQAGAIPGYRKRRGRYLELVAA